MKLVLVAEDGIEGIVDLPTEAERRAFSEGFSMGGRAYGAGSCWGVRVPEDLDDEDEFDWTKNPKRAELKADILERLAREYLARETKR